MSRKKVKLTKDSGSLVIPKPSEGEKLISPDTDQEVVLLDRLDDNGDSFLGLPYDIWKQIFHYAGVLCECHIAFVTVDHSYPSAPVALLGKQYRLPTRRRNNFGTKKGLITCSLRKICEYNETPCEGHLTHISMLRVSYTARYITLKALLQESSFHLELRKRGDLKGFINTLEGLDSINPLKHYLKRLHINLYSSSLFHLDYQPGFWDYFGSDLRGSLTHFNMECRPSTMKKAEAFAAYMAPHIQWLERYTILFDSSTIRSAKRTRHFSYLSDRYTLLEYIGSSENDGCGRFMDLPAEIHEMILSYCLVFEDPLSWNGGLWKVPAELQRYRQSYSHSCCMCSMLKNPTTSVARGVCDCQNELSPINHARLYLAADRAGPVSFCPILLTSKYMYNVGSRVFFSQNTFTLHTSFFFGDYRSALWLKKRSLPMKQLSRIRRLHLIIEYNLLPTYPTRPNLEAFKTLASFMRSDMQLVVLDLTCGSKYYPLGCAEYKGAREILALFDDFQGKRPENYQRAH